MIINIQAPEVSKLLFDMFAAMPSDVKESFAPRVYKITEILEHPCCSDGAVLLTLGSDGTF